MSKTKKTSLPPVAGGELVDEKNFPALFSAEEPKMEGLPTEEELAEPLLVEMTLKYAKDALDAGVKETKENWGPQIEKYLKAAGLDVPAPWCAAFVNYCAEQAAQVLHIPSTLEEVINEAYCPSYAAWAEKKGYLVKPKFNSTTKKWEIPSNVVPGALFLVWSGSRGRYAHIGFVESVDFENARFISIEGNSNNTGSREGFMVASNNRMVTKDIAFIVWQ